MFLVYGQGASLHKSPLNPTAKGKLRPVIFLLISFSVRQNSVWTSLDFPGLLLGFVKIMPDKVI
jgi:hypothetical protein